MKPPYEDRLREILGEQKWNELEAKKRELRNILLIAKANAEISAAFHKGMCEIIEREKIRNAKPVRIEV